MATAMQFSGAARPSSSDDPLLRFLERSPCPFAQLADIFRPPAWADPSANPQRLDALAGELQRSVESGDSDVLVLELRHTSDLDLADAAGLLRAVLGGLRDRDPDCAEPLASGIEDPDWDFEFCRERFFVSFFGSLYPITHSRCSGEDDLSFLLLQPERGFRRFGISSETPRRRELSERIHQRFRGRGSSYALRLNTDAPKVMRYLKPIGEDDKPIRWWQYP
jgi:hypothetical protein